MKLKVSSVNPSSVFRSSDFLNDNDECWYSDAGEFQSILVDFEEVRTVSKLSIQYQGGFAALNIDIKTPTTLINHMTEDINQIQYVIFNPITTQKLKLIFTNLSDPYGRLIVYRLMFE